MTRIVDSAPLGDPNWSGTKPDPASSKTPWRIYNIGNNRPEEVALLEKALGRQAEKKRLPMQAGDVLETFADVDDLMRDIDFKPRTSIKDRVEKFVAWYRDYHRG